MSRKSQRQNTSSFSTTLSPEIAASSLSSKVEQLKKILVVVAEDSTREILVKTMSVEGYSVISALDAHTALNLLKGLEFSQDKFLFDLIILDWTLPTVDELEICRWLRHPEKLSLLLILSAQESEAERISSLNAGADDYLPKPFSTQELVARCQALFRRHRFLDHLHKPIVLQFEELSLYPEEHRVLVRGKEVELTPKEFQLLQLFMSHPGQIWSRQQLFEQVWKPNFSGIPKNLDVYIHRLREKLELHPGHPKYIKTVARLGYRFGKSKA